MNIPGGWSKSPHQIYDAMPLMSGAEYKCTAVLVRETYGYHRRRARLTYADFMQQTGLKGRATIAGALQEIEARGFFRRTASPSEWQICELPGDEEDTGQTPPAHGRSQTNPPPTTPSANGGAPPQESAHGRCPPSIAHLERAVSELTRTVAELSQSNAALLRSNAELNRRLAGLITTIAGANSSLYEREGSANGSLYERKGSPGSSISETKRSIPTASAPAASSQNEPRTDLKSSKSEPLQLYKDKRSPAGQEREGEDSHSPYIPPAQPSPATSDCPQYGANGRQPPPNTPPSPPNPPPHPRIPTPRSAAESELAAHPALTTWLEAGFPWPGWERLAAVAGRLGPRPRLAILQQARQMWLMAGYRMSNTAGILDWYDELCRDPNWQPFTRRSPQAVPAARDISTPQSPAMAMLFKMREEIVNGQESDDRGLFDHAAVRLPPPRTRPANHPSLPLGAGRY